MKKTESIKLIFSGEDHIELNTLTTALKATVRSLETVSNNVLDSEDYCKFYVQNISKGSFIVEISAISEVAEMLIPIGTVIGSTFLGILGLRKFLKGKKPREIEISQDKEKYFIVNSDGENAEFNTNVVNIYTSNQNIEKELARASSALCKDSSRTEFSVITESGDLEENITFSKDELLNLSEPLDTSTILNEEVDFTSEETLGINTAVFHGRALWKMHRYGSGNISVKILDEDFLDRLDDSRIALKSGTKLKVILKTVVQKLESKYIDESCKYYIIEVLEVISPPAEEVINFE